MIIGIEGPAGSGKSTMAKTVAPEIKAVVIEGGAWFRALTYLALEQGIEPDEVDKLVSLARSMQVRIMPLTDGSTKVLLNNEDKTKELYQESVSKQIALFADKLAVREIIDNKVREEAHRHGSAILVGRHIKRAFPDALIMRLTIDPQEAERRHQARSGSVAVAARNQMDAKIAQSLGVHKAEVEIDVTHMTPKQQADALRQFIAQNQ